MTVLAHHIQPSAPITWPDFSRVNPETLEARDIIHGKALAREAGIPVAKIARQLGRPVKIVREAPPAKKSLHLPVVSDNDCVAESVVLRAAAKVFDLTMDDLRNGGRMEPFRSIRNCVYWALHTYCKTSNVRIAKELRRDRSCVIWGLRAIERKPNKFASALNKLDAEIRRTRGRS